MFIENSTDDRKSEARTNFGVNSIFHAIEAVKDALLVLGTDSIASVCDLDAQFW